MAGTSIGFGRGEVIEVGLPLNEVRTLLEDALANHQFVEFEDPSGKIVVINPKQVTVVQNSDA